MIKRYTLLVLSILFSTLSYGDYFSPQGPSGGYGGTHYNSGAIPSKVSEVRIYSGAYIDSIQFIYKNNIGGLRKGQKYGGNGGKLKVLKLADDEYIVSAGGKYGKFVDSLYLVTNKKRKMEWGGNGGDAIFHYQAPKSGSIWGFFGRAGSYIDAFGVIMKTPE